MDRHVEILFEKTALSPERRAARRELGRKGRGYVMSNTGSGLSADVAAVQQAAQLRRQAASGGFQPTKIHKFRGGRARTATVITGVNQPTPAVPRIASAPMRAPSAPISPAGAAPMRGFRARAGNLFGSAMNRFGKMRNLGKAGVIGAGLAGAGLVGSMVGSAFSRPKYASLQDVYNQAFEDEFLKLAKGA